VLKPKWLKEDHYLVLNHWCAIYLYFKGPFGFLNVKFDQCAQFTISQTLIFSWIKGLTISIISLAKSSETLKFLRIFSSDKVSKGFTCCVTCSCLAGSSASCSAGQNIKYFYYILMKSINY
jgi:hypothetical protein